MPVIILFLKWHNDGRNDGSIFFYDGIDLIWIIKTCVFHIFFLPILPEINIVNPRLPTKK